MSRRVKDMQIGDAIICTKHGGEVALSARMLREQSRMCDACLTAYKVQYGSAYRASAREKKPPLDTASLPGEVWRNIPSHPGYAASNLGRVRSIARTDTLGRIVFERVLKLYTNKRGYKLVRLSPLTKSVHAVVAEAFYGPRPRGMEVAHNDGNPSNNRADNLRYATRKENEADKDRHGTRFYAFGERNGHAKLKIDDVIDIVGLLRLGVSQVECARRYGIDPAIVSNIKRGRNWAQALKENGYGLA